MICVTLDAILAARGMGLTELSDKTGISLANLAALKDDRAAAVRLSTLDAVCAALDCRPGDLLEFIKTTETEG